MRSAEVAKLAGVTVRTLRHYHQIGLLAEPERDFNGYRRYDVHHLIMVLRIKALASLGLPLNRISPLLGDATEEADQLLDELDQAVARQIERLQEQRRLLAALRATSAPTDFPSQWVASFESYLRGGPGGPGGQDGGARARRADRGRGGPRRGRLGGLAARPGLIRRAGLGADRRGRQRKNTPGDHRRALGRVGSRACYVAFPRSGETVMASSEPTPRLAQGGSRWELEAKRRITGSRRVLKPCGTKAAYERHRRNGEPPCEACRAANTQDHAEYVGRRRKGAQVRRVERETPPCGTMAGYRRHLLNGEVACDACRAVNSATNREYYLRRRRQK